LTGAVILVFRVFNVFAGGLGNLAVSLGRHWPGPAGCPNPGHGFPAAPLSVRRPCMAEQRSANTAVKIVASMLVLLCGGLIYVGVQMTRKIISDLDAAFGGDRWAVHKFLTDIRAGELDNAYQSTTREFKERMSRAEFEELIKEHPAIKENRPYINIGMSNSPGIRQYTMKLEGEDLEFSITVTYDGLFGPFRVDQFTITKGKGKDEGKAPPNEGAKSEK
jgi:hypothetical protein